MIYISIFLAVLAFAVGAPEAWAKKVYSPHVEQGAIELESQTDVVSNPDPAKDGSVKQQFELSYGITDWWRSGIYAIYTRAGNASAYKYSATKLENIFVLPGSDAMDLDWGVYLEYITPTAAGPANETVEGKLLLETHAVSGTHTLNLTVKKDLGGNVPPASVGYAWRSGWSWDHTTLAVEAYGTFGAYRNFDSLSRQSHLIGPVAGFELWRGMEVEFGWLMDVNAGSRYGDFKLNIEMEF